jgi:hypothetical protein
VGVVQSVEVGLPASKIGDTVSYHDLSSSTLTADERRAEANKITGMLADFLDQMQDNERSFVTRISDFYAPVSVKQIYWLRDLSEKYL